jgi:hypothetical protein
MLALGSLVGCGEALYPVKGKITFEGKPIEGGGSISFIPLGTQKAAAGDLSEDSSFQLMTNKPGDGAMVGDYRVVVYQIVETEGERVGDGEKRKAKAGKIVPMDQRIPAIYSDDYNSPVTAKVEAKNPNEITIDLKRK